MSLRSVHRPHHHLSICTHLFHTFHVPHGAWNSFFAVTPLTPPLSCWRSMFHTPSLIRETFLREKKENRMYNMSGMSGTSGTTTTTTTTTTTYSTLCSTLVWNRVTGCAVRSCSEITRLFHSPPAQETVYYTLHPFLLHPLFHFSRLLLHSSAGLLKLALGFLNWH